MLGCEGLVGRGPTSAKNGRLGDITIPGFVPPVLKVKVMNNINNKWLSTKSSLSRHSSC